MQLVTEEEASRICTALDIDFQKTVQTSLNLLFERLRHTNTKITPQLLKKVKEVKLDGIGQASESSLKQVFAAIHFKDKDLFNKFCGVYEEATGEDCRYQDFQKIFSKPMLVKSLLVSAETLTSQQDGINGLALATGIWLEDFETLFGDKKLEKEWNDIVWKYIAALYDAMDSTKTAKQLHTNMTPHTKMLKKLTLKKWIGFLDNNKLKSVSSQNHKCLYMAKQVRTILPPIFEQNMSLEQCQQLIETEIGPFRKQQQDNDELNEREKDDEIMTAAAVPIKQSTGKGNKTQGQPQVQE